MSPSSSSLHHHNHYQHHHNIKIIVTIITYITTSKHHHHLQHNHNHHHHHRHRHQRTRTASQCHICLLLRSQNIQPFSSNFHPWVSFASYCLDWKQSIIIITIIIRRITIILSLQPKGKSSKRCTMNFWLMGWAP